MVEKRTSRYGRLRVLLGSLYLIIAVALASQTHMPILFASAAALFVLHEPAWSIAKRMHTFWLPATIASCFQATLAFLARAVPWNGLRGARLFELLLILSSVFAIIAVEEGVRELRWHRRKGNWGT